MRSVRGHARQYQPLTKTRPPRVAQQQGIGFALSVSWSPDQIATADVTYDNPDGDDGSSIGIIGPAFGSPTPPDPPYVVNHITSGFASGPGPYYTDPVVLNDRVQLVWFGLLFYSTDSLPFPGWDFADVGSHPDLPNIACDYNGAVCSGIEASTFVCWEGFDGSGGTVAPITFEHEVVRDNGSGGGCAWIVIGFEGFDFVDNYDATSCPGGWLYSAGYTAVVNVARMPGNTPILLNEAPFATHAYTVRGLF